MRETCGYGGHACSVGGVKFISRYRDTNDYCVDGRRISVTDAGQVRESFQPVAAEVVERIRVFELERYAAYVRFHSTSGLFKGLHLLPFEFRAEVSQ